MAKKNDRELAVRLLELVGGKDNVSHLAHCMTRLRFEVKDKSLVQEEELARTDGILGTQWMGEQMQIIVGPRVNSLYEILCELGGFQKSQPIDENLDKKKRKLSLSSLLSALSACLTPVLPVLIAASMIKAVLAVLGPSLLGIISEGSDIYTLLTFVGDAGFYFMPVYFGYTAAKKFGATPVLGLFLGAIMIHPTFVQLAVEGASFTVFGIPCTVVNYSSSMLPIILSVWVMSYVERFFKRYLPAALQAVLAPTLTILIMLPVTLCVFGPLGSVVGGLISDLLMGFAGLNGICLILTTALSACLWNFMVISGTHLMLYYACLEIYLANGFDTIVAPGFNAGQLAVVGMAIGAFLRMRNKGEKSQMFGYLISQVIGGVTEPSLYGIGIKYRRPLVGLAVGGFVGGIYYAVTGTGVYTLAATANFMIFASFAGGPAGNMANGIIGGLLACAVSAAVTYVLGFEKGDNLLRIRKHDKENKEGR